MKSSYSRNAFGATRPNQSTFEPDRSLLSILSPHSTTLPLPSLITPKFQSYRSRSPGLVSGSQSITSQVLVSSKLHAQKQFAEKWGKMKEWKQYFALDSLETIAGDLLQEFYQETLQSRVVRGLKVVIALKKFIKFHHLMLNQLLWSTLSSIPKIESPLIEEQSSWEELVSWYSDMEEAETLENTEAYKHNIPIIKIQSPPKITSRTNSPPTFRKFVPTQRIELTYYYRKFLSDILAKWQEQTTQWRARRISIVKFCKKRQRLTRQRVFSSIKYLINRDLRYVVIEKIVFRAFTKMIYQASAYQYISARNADWMRKQYFYSWVKLLSTGIAQKYSMVDEFHDRNLLSKFFIYFRKLSELRYQRLLQFYIHMGKRRIHRILIAWYDLRKGHIHRKLAKQLIEAQNMGLLQQVLARWKCQILRGIAWQKEIFEKVQIVRLRHIIYNWRKAIIYRDMRNEQAIAAFQVYQSLKLAFHAFQKAAKKRLIIRHRRQVLVRVLQSWKEVSTGLRLYRTAKSQERGGLEARVRFLNSRIRLNTLSRMLQNWRLRWEQRLEIKLSHSHYKYKVANNTFQAIKQYNLSQRLTSAFMSAAASTLLANRIKSMMVTLEVSHFRKSKLQSKAWIGFQMNSDGVRLDTVLHHMRSRRLCKTALSSWVLFSLHSVLARTGEDNYEHKLTLKAWVGWRILSDIRQFLNERNFPAAMTAARTFGHNSNKSVSKIAKIHFQHRLLKRALAALIEQHHFLGTLPLTLQNLPISPIGDLKAAEALADQRRQVKDLTIVLEDDDEDACNEQNTNAEELQLPANATLKCRMLVNLIRKRHTLSGLFAKWKAGKPARRYDFPRSPANATAASHTNSPHGKVDFPRSPANATESSRPNSPHGKNDFPRSPAKATATSQPKCPVPKSAPPKPTPAPAQPKPSATNPIQAKRAPNRIKVAKKPPVKNKENITDKLLKASSEARKERRDKAQSAYEQALQKHKPSMQSARAQMSSAKQMQKSVRDRKNKKISKIISTMATSPPKVPLTEKSSSSGMSTLGETLLKFQHDLTTPK